MYGNSSATRPDTLFEGHAYLLHENGNNGSGEIYSPVEFVSYDPCPAMVIVRNTAGQRCRCPREDLRTLPEL